MPSFWTRGSVPSLLFGLGEVTVIDYHVGALGAGAANACGEWEGISRSPDSGAQGVGSQLLLLALLWFPPRDGPRKWLTCVFLGKGRSGPSRVETRWGCLLASPMSWTPKSPCGFDRVNLWASLSRETLSSLRSLQGGRNLA